MTFTVYLLSIVDSVRGVLGPIAVLGTLGSIIGTVAYLLLCGDREFGAQNDVTMALRKVVSCTWAVAAFSTLVCAATPSLYSLRQAYLYSEAAKLATAPNAEKVVSETMKRMDRVLGMFEKALDGRAKP